MSEQERLLADEDIIAQDHLEGGSVRGSVADGDGENYDHVPKTKRQLGLFSAISVISSRTIGTGIFATPSIILRSSGSVGMSLTMWVAGAAVASAGTAVYLEFGTGLPRSGGEKVYLEFIFRRPKYMMSCAFASLVFFVAGAAGGSVIFGEYALRAYGLEPTSFGIRIMASLILFFSFVVHSYFYKFGVRLQNTLGSIGFVNLVVVAMSGILVQLGVVKLKNGKELPKGNFEQIWEDTRWEANSLITALYSIIWSYFGYNSANYVLSEAKDPIRTIKKAAPIALSAITVTYLLVNVAYFIVVDKEEIVASGQAVTALFFRDVYGEGTERLLDFFISLSAMGNIMSVVFTKGRVMQELGREDIIPFSSVFASSTPFNAPTAGIFHQVFISCLAAIIPPPGDAYAFILNYSSYPYTICNLLISGGLLALHTPYMRNQFDWSPPFVAWTWVIAFFTLSNAFLFVVPFIPPEPGSGPYQHLPYWSHCTIVMAIGLFGILIWFVRFRVLPYWKDYKLLRIRFRGDDGVSRVKFRKVYTN